MTQYGSGEGTFAERLGDLASAPVDEQVVLARREIVDHCLYGVDKNPVAAEMAKLSLWLTTMARERPFTFLDHAIQVGDSLLGITDLEQLRWLHLDPSQRKGVGGFETLALDERIREATELARHLQELSVVTVRDASEKQRLHEDLRGRLADLATVADTVVGAAISTAGKRGQTMEERLGTQLLRVRTALDAASSASERSAALAALRGISTGWLRTDPAEGVPTPWERLCLHWPLAFPEVFLGGDGRRGFDCFVGNPPFLGKKYWKQTLGDPWLTYVDLMLGPAPKLNLAGVFLRRVSDLLSRTGAAGLICPASLTEGGAAEASYGVLNSYGCIYRARPFFAWPGEANVDVSLVWFSRQETFAGFYINDEAVTSIDERLSTRDRSRPLRLARIDLDSFIGSNNVAGEALLLRDGDEWVDRLRGTDSPFLSRYVTGEDITKHAMERLDRWVVDVGDLNLDRVALASTVTRDFLEQVVSPARDNSALDRYKGLRDRWWQIWSHNAASYRRLRMSDSCLVLPVVSKYVVAMRAPTSYTYTNKVCIVLETRPDLEVLLNSALFDHWAREYSGSMGLRVQLSMADAVHTFCGPGDSIVFDSLADWQVARSELLGHTAGLTGLYNGVHNPNEKDRDIVGFRELQVALDHAVRDAYGWADLELDHHHWETPQGMRFTVSPAAKDELLDRLLELNHQRYAEEVAAGLHDKKSKKTPAKRAKAVDENQESML